MLIAMIFTAVAVSADPALNGRWADEWASEFIFNNGNWELREDSFPVGRGTYTVSGNAITLTFTHVHGIRSEFASDTGWYSRDEIIELAMTEFETNLIEEMQTNELLALVENYSLEEIREDIDETLRLMNEIFTYYSRATYDHGLFTVIAEMVLRVLMTNMDVNPEIAERVKAISDFFATMLFFSLQEELFELFESETGIYSISDNTLTIEWDNGWTETLTRR